MQAVTFEECSQPFSDKGQIEGIKIQEKKTTLFYNFSH